MSGMFDISVRLKPIISEPEPTPLQKNARLRSRRLARSRRSKSTAYLGFSSFYRKKKMRKKSESAFEVHGNKLSVETPKSFFEYSFKKVFYEDVNNQEVYKGVIRKDLKKIIDGKWLTVMTYGTSGSGKTYTIFGESNGERGLISYSVEHLYRIFAERRIRPRITCCILEIYNEQVSNLLPGNIERVELRENDRGEAVLKHAEYVEVKNAPELISLVESGAKSRHIAENFSNKRSSRSHMIVLLDLEFMRKGQLITSKIAFLDLAGSERVVLGDKSLQTEGSSINKSLLALTNCITILSQKDKKAYVPYRDSKLTRLLKGFMDNNQIIKFLVCLKQEQRFLEESLNTLNYAFQAQKIEKRKKIVKLNAGTTGFYKHKIAQLQKELRLLKMRSPEQRKVRTPRNTLPIKNVCGFN